MPQTKDHHTYLLDQTVLSSQFHSFLPEESFDLECNWTIYKCVREQAHDRYLMNAS